MQSPGRKVEKELRIEMAAAEEGFKMKMRPGAAASAAAAGDDIPGRHDVAPSYKTFRKMGIACFKAVGMPYNDYVAVTVMVCAYPHYAFEDGSNIRSGWNGQIHPLVHASAPAAET